MSALFDLFLTICLFRRGPQHVPAATALLQLTGLAYLLSGAVTLVSGGTVGFLQALLLAGFELTLLLGFVYGLLYLKRKPARFVQTATALLGVGTLLNLMALPLLVWLQGAFEAQGSPLLPMTLWLLLICWSLAINGHILAEALSQPRIVGVLYSLGYFVASVAMTQPWLPAGG